MSGRHVLKLALSCYPRWWRDRYADEVGVHVNDLVIDGRAPLGLAINLMAGAARARWSARGMPMDYRLWATRNRVSVAWATLTWLLVVPAMLLATGSQQIGMRVATTTAPYHVPAVLPTAPAGRLVSYCGLAMTLIAFVTLLFLVRGWSHLIGGIRRSSSPGRTRVLWLAWVPGIAFLVYLVGAVIDVAVIRPTGWMISGRDRHITYLNGHPAVAHTFGTALNALGITGWLLSIVCLAVVARRSEVGLSDLQIGTRVSAAVAALFALLFATYVTWGIGLTLEAHEAAQGAFNVVSYSRQGLWPLAAVIAGLAVAISITSALTARRSWSVLTAGWS